MTYEEALKKLEAIANNMEQGEVSIDKLTEQLAEANKLIELCKTKLTQTDAEVQKLINATA